MRRALAKVGVVHHAYSQAEYQRKKQAQERREERAVQTLTQKIEIPSSTWPNGQVVEKKEPIVIHKERLIVQQARVKLNELVAQGKTPEEATTVLLSVFDVYSGLGRPVGRDKLVALAGRPFTRRSPIEVKREKEAAKKAREAKAAKAKEPENKEKPVARPIPDLTAPARSKPAVKTPPLNGQIDETLSHVRSVITLPFDKSKKLEIIIDLLDKLL